MICPRCAAAADRRAPADQHCTDPRCMCGHRTDRYRPPAGFGMPAALFDGMHAAVAEVAGLRFEGEHGPELVQLPHGTTVHPLTTTKD